ncbi:MAG TPA: threonine/serine dehydratase [Gemmatimonadaceae bacterium]|nr:threonine/serine dehydratase [Gemmatimonadaceae bacterium]
MISLDDIEDARDRIRRKVHVTPMMTASRLGDRAGVQLYLKCENFQKTGSFKVRGVLNKLAQLDPEARARGVVTVSAGNHAQALAWAARAAGVKATVVMSTVASPTKIEASRGYGAEVVLHGSTNQEAFAKAHELKEQRGLTFVHPFDDDAVIAGAGTVALEMREQAPLPDAVVVPVGGGGLIAGILVALKSQHPRIRVYGVEPAGAPAMRRSLDEGRAVHLDAVNTIADGLGAPMAGERNYQIVKEFADDVVLLDDAAIAAATRDLLFSAKVLAEPAGAAALAAVLSRAIPLRAGERVIAIVSGGNVDAGKLVSILE